MRVVLREGSFKHPGLLELIGYSVHGRKFGEGINQLLARQQGPDLANQAGLLFRFEAIFRMVPRQRPRLAAMNKR